MQAVASPLGGIAGHYYNRVYLDQVVCYQKILCELYTGKYGQWLPAAIGIVSMLLTGVGHRIWLPAVGRHDRCVCGDALSCGRSPLLGHQWHRSQPGATLVTVT